MRVFLNGRLGFFLVFVLVWIAGLGRAVSAPNILIIFSDDQGTHDVGCYGSEIPTPHIDSLARDGLKFNQFYAASSICTPSRFGLLTGRNPSRSRDHLLNALMFLGPADKVRGIRSDETTVATVLQASGYATSLIGKWHLGHGQSAFFPNHHGFQHAYGHTAGCIDFFTMCYGNTPDWYRNEKPIKEFGYATDLITEEAVRYLRERETSKPFFMFLAYNAPHFGKGWDDGKDQTVNLLQPHPRDLERVSFIPDLARRKFAAMTVAMDDGIGRVLQTVDDLKLRQDTLVIFMTDHGGDPNYGGSNEPLRGHKATLFEGGIRVPCLVRWPGVVAAGRQTDAPTSALDWFPTLGTVAGVSTNGLTLDGLDISELLQGKPGTRSREFFWETGSHAELERGNWAALRQDHWKFVRTPDGQEWLFDLAADPGEQNNLAPSQAARFAAMRKKTFELRRYYQGN